MPAAASERMSRVDTAWLRMDNDVNLMMIVGVWLLQPGVSLSALRQRMADKLLKYDRFRQKAVHDAMGALWVEDEDFDIARHVVPAALDLPAAEHTPQQAQHALQQLCGELAMTPLDPARPLWQFHLVEHYDGGSAMIARVHHCIGAPLARQELNLGFPALLARMRNIRLAPGHPPPEAEPGAGLRCMMSETRHSWRS